MKFFLGTHKPVHLLRTDVPLFISRRRLIEVKNVIQPKGEWALDSGAFTELSIYGRWTIPATQYSTEVRGFYQKMRGLKWAAAQDWMCEPFIIEKTGLSVREHQRRTVANFLLLRQLAPDLPWLPVIQGFEHHEYWQCVEAYHEAGIDLRDLPIVGLGSVCRRQNTDGVEELIRELHGYGINLHAFGFKIGGIARCAKYLTSSDSMAWSFDARRADPMPGCPHKSCANCLRYALDWRDRKIIPAISRGMRPSQQLRFMFA